MNSVIMQQPNDYIYVQVYNGGGFIAEVYLDYIYNGRQYYYDSGWVFLGSTIKAQIPGMVKNLHMKIEVWLYKKLMIAFDGPVRNYLPSCFHLYGTIYYPVCAQIPCTQMQSLLCGTNPYNNQCCNRC